MSTYAQFDEDGEQFQIASNVGWSEFGDWCEQLDVDKYPTLVQLSEHGVVEDLSALEDEVNAALSENAPDENTAGVAKNLLAALEQNPDAETLLITNGVETAGDDSAS